MITVKQRPYLYNWTGNSVYYQLYSAAAASDASIYFEVRIFFKYAGDTDYSELVTMPYTPVAGSVKFNIQDVLHAHLNYAFPDLYSDATIIDQDKQSGSFYIDFREVTTDDLNPAWDSSEVTYFRHIIKGGIHPFQFKGNNYWNSYHATNRPFLTWQPSGRLAAYSERMYLAWYCQQFVATPNLVVRVVVTFVDETQATKEFVFPNTLHYVHYIPVGAQQLDLQLLGLGKRIWHWTVQLVNKSVGEIAASQQYQYFLDNRNDYNGITLHYRNSLGGIDSVRIRGDIDEAMQHEITETAGLLASDYFMNDQLPALDSVHKSKETITFKGDIGHLSRQEQDRLRDAFLNRQCYQERSGKWWPVKLLNTNTKLRSTRDKRFSMPIEWQYADGGSYFYTPDIDLGPGMDSDNVCNCTIQDLQVNMSFGAGNTIAYATFQFGVFCPDGDAIDTVQYRLTGGEWVDLAFPYMAPPVYSFAPNQFYTAEWRVKCPSGEFGPVSTIAVNANVPGTEPTPDPEPDPEDPMIMIRLYNNLYYTQTFHVIVDLDTIQVVTLNPGQYATFYRPGPLVEAAFQLRISSITPAEALLVISGSDPVYGYISSRWVTWDLVDVPSGVVELIIN